MRIRVNGELTELAGIDGETPRLDRVLVDLGYKGRGMAVAVNETFVPRRSWTQRTIESGDRLDVVAPIQGG